MTIDEWITVQEAATQAGCSKGLIHKMAKENQLQYKRVGSQMLIHQSQIEVIQKRLELNSPKGRIEG